MLRAVSMPHCSSGRRCPTRSPRRVTDAHIAALPIEHQAEVHSNDSDFARFAGLRWRNPL